MKPTLHHFSEFPAYSDPGAVQQLCRNFLARGAGQASHLQMGVCEITGPGRVAEDAHATWTQYFLVIEGEGTVFLRGVPHPLQKDMIVEIPKDTSHYAACAEGQRLRYFFINIHDA